MSTAINISEIYTEYSKMVFGYLNWKLGDIHDAEEVTNDVFIKIMRLQENPETSFNDNLSAFPTWLHNITKSVLIDFTRTNHQDKYKAVSDFSDADGNPFFQFKSPDDAQKQMERKELRDRINTAIANLKPNYRKIAELRFEKELKYEEIALELDLPEGTVKGMVNRCKKMLKKELDDLRKPRKTNVQTSEKVEA